MPLFREERSTAIGTANSTGGSSSGGAAAYYRFTWRIRLMSGPAYPDMWEEGRSVRQDFALPLPASIVPGPYEVRVKVIRAPYLENRSVADYLSNDDSLQGVPVGMIYLREESRERDFRSGGCAVARASCQVTQYDGA